MWAHRASVRLAAYLGLSVLVHLLLIAAIKPYSPHPFRSIGLSAQIAVEATGGTGGLLVGPALQIWKAPRPSAQSMESVPQRRQRRAVLIPDTDFGLHLDLNSVPSPSEGKDDIRLLSLHLPTVPEKYFSAGEVDIRAEPITDLIPVQTLAKLETSQAVPGHLKMRLLIDETGRVIDAEILEAYPPNLVELITPAQLRDVTFAPARISGMAVKSQKIIEFKIDPDSDP